MLIRTRDLTGNRVGNTQDHLAVSAGASGRIECNPLLIIVDTDCLSTRASFQFEAHS
jgi:hypothetical protein